MLPSSMALNRTSYLPDGDAGTLATLQSMRSLARRDALDQNIRMVTTNAVRGVPGDFGIDHAKLIRAWVTERTYFIPDPTYAEALQAPAWAVKQILTRGNVGLDCEDVAMLTAAMGLSIGLRARFVIVGFVFPEAAFRHVWSELASASGGEWVVIDPTRPVQSIAGLHISRIKKVEV